MLPGDDGDEGRLIAGAWAGSLRCVGAAGGALYDGRDGAADGAGAFWNDGRLTGALGAADGVMNCGRCCGDGIACGWVIGAAGLTKLGRDVCG